MLSRFWLLSVSMASLVLSACSDDPVGPVLTASVVSVVPTGGSTDVDPNAPVVVAFSHAMQSGVEQYAALHEGDVTGLAVAGAWAWSDDRTTLTFTPAESLKAETRYTLHLGGGMRANDGGFLDFGSCVGQHGGQWATSQMVDGGMMGGENMMGAGWRHPNGAYGMVFTFTIG